jgi:hypothetical protein
MALVGLTNVDFARVALDGADLVPASQVAKTLNEGTEPLADEFRRLYVRLVAGGVVTNEAQSASWDHFNASQRVVPGAVAGARGLAFVGYSLDLGADYYFQVHDKAAPLVGGEAALHEGIFWRNANFSLVIPPITVTAGLTWGISTTPLIFTDAVNPIAKISAGFYP